MKRVIADIPDVRGITGKLTTLGRLSVPSNPNRNGASLNQDTTLRSHVHPDISPKVKGNGMFDPCDDIAWQDEMLSQIRSEYAASQKRRFRTGFVILSILTVVALIMITTPLWWPR